MGLDAIVAFVVHASNRHSAVLRIEPDELLADVLEIVILTEQRDVGLDSVSGWIPAGGAHAVSDVAHDYVHNLFIDLERQTTGVDMYPKQKCLFCNTTPSAGSVDVSSHLRCSFLSYTSARG